MYIYNVQRIHNDPQIFLNKGLKLVIYHFIQYMYTYVCTTYIYVRICTYICTYVTRSANLSAQKLPRFQICVAISYIVALLTSGNHLTCSEIYGKSSKAYIQLGVICAERLGYIIVCRLK